MPTGRIVMVRGMIRRRRMVLMAECRRRGPPVTVRPRMLVMMVRPRVRVMDRLCTLVTVVRPPMLVMTVRRRTLPVEVQLRVLATKARPRMLVMMVR